MTSELRLPFDDPAEPVSLEVIETPELPDADARRYAVDPGKNVVLEASAGTGKTRVLVDRYVNLLQAGVDPDNILAMTFTRKAAAEMRQRIVERLRDASRVTPADRARWLDLRGRLADIAISTIDAFCLSLLREFPLEADVDPRFELADDTEVPRLIEEALNRALRICRALAATDDDVALVFAQLGERRLRVGLASLLDRRLLAPQLLARYLADGPKTLTAAVACRISASRLQNLFAGLKEGVRPFLRSGPVGRPQFAMLADDILRLCEGSVLEGLDSRPGQAAYRAFVDRLRGYFLTQDGKPRGERFSGTSFNAGDCASQADWKRHRDRAASIAPAVAEAIHAFRRDVNVVLSRGVWRILAIVMAEHRRALDARALLDFPGVLERAINLLKQMDEFARSRYRLESRYHHVLVDEFQDTSRAQWELVAQLVRSWSEGAGVSASAIPPSIFLVGDRKQSIYGFRDAETALFDEAAGFVGELRGENDARRAISVSFRSSPALLAFVNDVFDAIRTGADEDEAPDYRFRYGDQDRFPVDRSARVGSDGADDCAVGLVTGGTVQEAAEAVADEIVRLLETATVRDKATGLFRSAGPADIAILFRSRESHREFEAALERRGVQTYVYKGLGFFEANEIQDAVAVLRFLADPMSDLRAASFLRSRIVRLSDRALMQLAPSLANALLAEQPVEAFARLSVEDSAVLAKTRTAVARWLGWIDLMSPAELLDGVLRETAYDIEIRGPRRAQARENLKKLRAMIRRIQNRGYATLSRIADHLERLAVGDESNAAIDAIDAVNLMTVHAAKGLEFPIVFVVNMGRGTGSTRPPIRVATASDGRPAVAIADFQSDADDETQARGREETKRLLYVAMTRARDRLYLSATVTEGGCRTGRGSLGEVLPRSLVALFPNDASEQPIRLNWTTGEEGRATHPLFGLAYKPGAEPRTRRPPEPSASPPDDFSRL
jgi:ATP-dependent helicase/nuclease subunit A